MTPSEDDRKRHDRLDSILVAFFVCALLAPWVDEIVRTNDKRGPKEHEQREPSPRPVLDERTLQTYPEQYSAYFDDTFGLRDFLLRWHSIEKYFVFGVSPTSRVVLGKDDWMFYTGDHSIEVYRGLLPFTQKELESWQRMIEHKRDLLKARGIEYLFVIGPNKESVYPDYMAPRFNRVHAHTRMDQLVDHMRAKSDVEVLDLRPALIAGRSADVPDNHTYFELGTHWNGRGCYISYHEVMARLAKRFPNVAPTPASELVYVDVPGSGDSWASNMYIADLVPQHEVQYAPKDPPRAKTVLDTGWGMGRKHWMEVDDPSLPRAVMFHDSFGAYIDGLMAEHFSRFTCFWQYDFDTRVIASEKPDIVVELYVERALQNLSAAELSPRQEDKNDDAFAQSEEVVFNLDIARDAGKLKPMGKAEIHAARDDSGPEIVVEMKTLADTFLLPAFEFPNGKRLLGRVDITASTPSMFSIFYKHVHDPDYHRKNSCVVPLSQGRNQVFFEIEQPDLSGPLMVRAGDRVGRYTLQAFEIRALPLR
jgi:hypothetical protein